MDDDEAHLSATEARGGQTTHTMRYVLAISLFAVVALFAIILIINR